MTSKAVHLTDEEIAVIKKIRELRRDKLDFSIDCINNCLYVFQKVRKGIIKLIDVPEVKAVK